MTTIFQKKLQLLKNFFATLGDHDVLRIDESGERRWFAIVSTAALIFLVALALHYRLFLYVQSVDTVAADASRSGSIRLDQKSLDRALELYASRAVLFEETLTASSTLFDPSR